MTGNRKAGRIAVNNGIRNCIRTLIFLLMGIQILLGLLWMFENLTGYQKFAESTEFLNVTSTWMLDEYLGIAYPVCLWLVRAIGGEIGISYSILLYLLQVAVAFVAGVRFLHVLLDTPGSSEKKMEWKVYYGSAYLLTFPLLLQFHMAVLPYSLGMSAFFFLLAEGLVLLKKEEKPDVWTVVRFGLLWVIGSAFLPDYGWLGGMVVFFVFVALMWRDKKVYLMLPILYILFLAVISGASAVTQTPGSRGRIQKSVEAAMLSRVVWPNFIRNAYFWNTYITDVFDPEGLQTISLEAEEVRDLFGPAMEEAYGREKANEVYWQMVTVSMEVRTKEVVSAMALDGVSYLCPPVAVQLNLAGKGASYTGWNYSRMQAETPACTKFYMNGSLQGWNVAACLAAVLLSWRQIERIIRGKKSSSMKGERRAAHLLLFTGLIFTLWYTMFTGGMQDYKNVMVVSALWATLVIKGWRMERSDHEEA